LKAVVFIPNFSPTWVVRQAGPKFLSDHALLAAAGLRNSFRKAFLR
jgi:hypothetical protein